MLRIVIEVDAPVGQAIGVKEDFAMYLERFGDSRVVEVQEMEPVQLELFAKNRKTGREPSGSGSRSEEERRASRAEFSPPETGGNGAGEPGSDEVEEVAPEQMTLTDEKIRAAYAWLEENGLRVPSDLQAD